jgi:predicted RNase H-like nuclease (RuvC/YqgF family)
MNPPAKKPVSIFEDELHPYKEFRRQSDVWDALVKIGNVGEGFKRQLQSFHAVLQAYRERVEALEGIERALAEEVGQLVRNIAARDARIKELESRVEEQRQSRTTVEEDFSRFKALTLDKRHKAIDIAARRLRQAMRNGSWQGRTMLVFRTTKFRDQYTHAIAALDAVLAKPR